MGLNLLTIEVLLALKRSVHHLCVGIGALQEESGVKRSLSKAKLMSEVCRSDVAVVLPDVGAEPWTLILFAEGR